MAPVRKLLAPLALIAGFMGVTFATADAAQPPFGKGGFDKGGFGKGPFGGQPPFGKGGQPGKGDEKKGEKKVEEKRAEGKKGEDRKGEDRKGEDRKGGPKADAVVDAWVAVLIAKITDPHDTVRESARGALVGVGPAAVPALQKLADGDDPAKAVAARKLIAAIQGTRGAQPGRPNPFGERGRTASAEVAPMPRVAPR